jgi:hypothetical protein
VYPLETPPLFTNAERPAPPLLQVAPDAPSGHIGRHDFTGCGEIRRDV